MKKGASLYLDGITVSFDGFRALNNLSLIVEPGELRAVIGPNGAGKTTMMDVITGKTKPDSGIARFGDHDLTWLDETRIANLGIGQPCSMRSRCLKILNSRSRRRAAPWPPCIGGSVAKRGTALTKCSPKSA
jgi:ABC-type uncharacterized transport system ATPase subunit